MPEQPYLRLKIFGSNQSTSVLTLSVFSLVFDMKVKLFEVASYLLTKNSVDISTETLMEPENYYEKILLMK